MLRPGALHRGSRIVVASHNEGKVRELGELFEPYGIECVSAGSLSLPEPEETGETFEANALLKAHAAAAGSGMIAIADDSGLEVEALGGYPGIHSARWGGPAKDFDHAMQRVQAALEATGGGFRRANFTCALALAAPNGEEAVFTGRVFGAIVWPPRGDRGFGYDPIFVPEGYEETFGEMDPALKNDLSHRMRAFEQLIEATYAEDEDENAS
ncbi:RdgB/HAM1 family non-canonical purine NTP pyrophosphatase [Methyloceanibacter sp.]|uniref:RdgB/HAM1 family non-canonical purine NTP pyrophosphatase n=1 Tax=Methyloceanibacter sp. TaxID=1965321 RepID=UPI0025E96408|nr:RdgB/HAM1 family non-canonical purine NTP pyrophosphatase [Methyloceanibacter sp.]